MFVNSMWLKASLNFIQQGIFIYQHILDFFCFSFTFSFCIVLACHYLCKWEMPFFSF